jgi:hypothetical protein
MVSKEGWGLVGVRYLVVEHGYGSSPCSETPLDPERRTEQLASYALLDACLWLRDSCAVSPPTENQLHNPDHPFHPESKTTPSSSS